MSTKRTFEKKVNKELFHVTDWFPTLLSMGGISSPAKNDKFDIDGRDYSSYFDDGKTNSEPREKFIVGVYHYVRQNEWKIDYCARYGKYKFCNYRGGNQQLMRCDVKGPSDTWIPEQSRTAGVTSSYLQRLAQLTKARLQTNLEFSLVSFTQL